MAYTAWPCIRPARRATNWCLLVYVYTRQRNDLVLSSLQWNNNRFPFSVSIIQAKNRESRNLAMTSVLQTCSRQTFLTRPDPDYTGTAYDLNHPTISFLRSLCDQSQLHDSRELCIRLVCVTHLFAIIVYCQRTKTTWLLDLLEEGKIFWCVKIHEQLLIAYIHGAGVPILYY